jgi:hypothetical protein
MCLIATVQCYFQLIQEGFVSRVETAAATRSLDIKLCCGDENSSLSAPSDSYTGKCDSSVTCFQWVYLTSH